MVSIFDVHPRELVEAMAAELKKMPEMAPPAWAAYVKTGSHNMRPPAEDDWWYIRSASVLRTVYKLGPIGVSKLRTKYGGRKNRGVKPDRTVKASGNILRKILQKLEIIGFVKQTEIGVHKGRIITPKGKSFVDKLVVKTKKPYEMPKKPAAAKPKKTEEKKQEKPSEQPTKVAKSENKPKAEEKPKEEKPKEEEAGKPAEKKAEKNAEPKEKKQEELKKEKEEGKKAEKKEEKPADKPKKKPAKKPAKKKEDKK